MKTLVIQCGTGAPGDAIARDEAFYGSSMRVLFVDGAFTDETYYITILSTEGRKLTTTVEATPFAASTLDATVSFAGAPLLKEMGDHTSVDVRVCALDGDGNILYAACTKVLNGLDAASLIP